MDFDGLATDEAWEEWNLDDDGPSTGIPTPCSALAKRKASPKAERRISPSFDAGSTELTLAKRARTSPSYDAGSTDGLGLTLAVCTDDVTKSVCAMCLRTPSQVEWRAKKVVATNTYIPVENACVECPATVAEGWPNLTWDDAVGKACQEPTFRKEVLTANSVRLGQEKDKFLKQEVLTVLTSGKRIENSAWSYSEKGFVKKFGITVEQAGLKLEDDCDEFGETWRGVTIADESADGEKERRKVTFFTERVDQYLLTTFRPEDSIRQGQARDHFEWVRGDGAAKAMAQSRVADPDSLKAKAAALREELRQRNQQESPSSHAGTGASGDLATAQHTDDTPVEVQIGDIVREEAKSGPHVHTGRAAALAALGVVGKDAKPHVSSGKVAKSAQGPGVRRCRPKAGPKGFRGRAAEAGGDDAILVTGATSSKAESKDAAGLMTGDQDVDAQFQKLNVQSILDGKVSRLGPTVSTPITATSINQPSTKKPHPFVGLLKRGVSIEYCSCLVG